MMLEATTVGSSHMDSMKNTWRKEARQTCKNNRQKANLDVTGDTRKETNRKRMGPGRCKVSQTQTHTPIYMQNLDLNVGGQVS